MIRGLGGLWDWTLFHVVMVPVYLPPGRGDLLWYSAVALRPPHVGWRYIMNILCVIIDFRVICPCVSGSLWGGPCGVLPLASVRMSDTARGGPGNPQGGSWLLTGRSPGGAGGKLGAPCSKPKCCGGRCTHRIAPGMELTHTGK